VTIRWWACFVKDGREMRALLLHYTGADIDAAMFHARSKYGRRAQGVYTFDLAPPPASAHEQRAKVGPNTRARLTRALRGT
jgi:hypothetical protein